MMRALAFDDLGVLGAVVLFMMRAAVDLVAGDAVGGARGALNLEQLLVAIEPFGCDGPHLLLIDVADGSARKKDEKHDSETRPPVSPVGRQSDEIA